MITRKDKLIFEDEIELLEDYGFLYSDFCEEEDKWLK